MLYRLLLETLGRGHLGARRHRAGARLARAAPRGCRVARGARPGLAFLLPLDPRFFSEAEAEKKEKTNVGALHRIRFRLISENYSRRS